ncbi:MAG: diaminopimelate decarboxylase [Ignavibacteriae bacterium]|nr:diaminopimelate decarboxylase [Ignavibacteria bacterium]MBI3365480.1 diaminopimelate decarboxylase [Ignavibacteriota bacterium]
MEQFHYKNNELWCEEVNVDEIVRNVGTPVYVYSRRSIVDHCRWIEQAFGTIDHLSCYAVKANANREVLRTLAHEGIGADAGSVGELYLALAAGFPPEKITFSGVGKRNDEIEFALRRNILSFNAESEEEIQVLSDIAGTLATTARVFLRVNFDIKTTTHPYITTGRRHNKFGVDSSKALSVLRSASRLPGLEVVGIHSHIGSQIIDEETFIAAAEALSRVASNLRSEGINITQINFGGGFGVQYRNYITHRLLPLEPENPEAEVTTVRLLQAILPILKKTGCRIFIQPGRSIVAHAGILLTKVLYRKQGDGKIFVIADAGMNDLIRPSLYQSYHQIVPTRLVENEHEIVDVVGPLCETGDFFALDRRLPHVDRGDSLAVLCAGAYGYVLSSNYNGRPRPAEVMVDGDTFAIVTPREVLEDL